MQTAPLHTKEKARLEALRQTGALDSEPEESFDRLTALAARLCGAPIALITLVDVDRQWFKSRVGLDVSETPRDVAFCAHAILQPGMMVVRDALEDLRFADNPLVVSDPKIRFYAGNPLVTHDGNAIGTFCVIDTVPRDLDRAQVKALETLSNHATTILELRRTKEVLKANASEWERATASGNTAVCSAALARLGHDLEHLIEARERAEASFRDLERSLKPMGLQAGATIRAVDPLLNEIVECSERVRRQLGPEHPLRADAARISTCAREARERLTSETSPPSPGS